MDVISFNLEMPFGPYAETGGAISRRPSAAQVDALASNYDYVFIDDPDTPEVDPRAFAQHKATGELLEAEVYGTGIPASHGRQWMQWRITEGQLAGLPFDDMWKQDRGLFDVLEDVGAFILESPILLGTLFGTGLWFAPWSIATKGVIAGALAGATYIESSIREARGLEGLGWLGSFTLGALIGGGTQLGLYAAGEIAALAEQATSVGLLYEMAAASFEVGVDVADFLYIPGGLGF